MHAVPCSEGVRWQLLKGQYIQVVTKIERTKKGARSLENLYASDTKATTNKSHPLSRISIMAFDSETAEKIWDHKTDRKCLRHLNTPVSLNNLAVFQGYGSTTNGYQMICG